MCEFSRGASEKKTINAIAAVGGDTETHLNANDIRRKEDAMSADRYRNKSLVGSQLKEEEVCDECMIRRELNQSPARSFFFLRKQQACVVLLRIGYSLIKLLPFEQEVSAVDAHTRVKRCACARAFRGLRRREEKNSFSLSKTMCLLSSSFLDDNVGVVVFPHLVPSHEYSVMSALTVIRGTIWKRLAARCSSFRARR